MTPEEVNRYLLLACWCHCAIYCAESTIQAYKRFLRVAVRLFGGTGFMEWIVGITEGLPHLAQTVISMKRLHEAYQQPNLLNMENPLVVKAVALEGTRALYQLMNETKTIRPDVLGAVDIQAPEAVQYHMMCILVAGTADLNNAPYLFYRNLIVALNKVFADLCTLNEQCSYVIRVLQSDHSADWQLLPAFIRHQNQN